jgi:hypothetical protein
MLEKIMQNNKCLVLIPENIMIDVGTAFICTVPTQLQDEPHLSQPLIFT